MTKPKQTTTPLFPDFHLATLRRKPRSAQQILKQEQKKRAIKTFDHLQYLLKDFLPKDPFDNVSGRSRLFTKQNTFYTFLHQCWSEDGSCQEALSRLREQADAQGMKKLPSASTSAYVQARHRLDIEELRDVFYHGAGTIEADGGTLHDERPWVVVDGTGLSMPDTKENQDVWPQSSNQKAGLGFPNAKVVASLSLHTGAVLDAEFGNQHDHEIILFRRLSDSFQKGDIVIGDRGFDSWHDSVELLHKGVDTVFRRHARRSLFKTSEAEKILGKGDLLIASKRPVQAPPHIKKQDWKKLPEELKLRQITFRKKGQPVHCNVDNFV
ncbi:transposase [Kiritimatiellota bacterium B12222]|nr:transposase [Kiritimatiellota bacterium B12222]